MEIKIDLLRNNKKSLLRLLLGISFAVISILMILPKLIENELIRPFDWIFSGVFAFNGMIYIFWGLGTSVERFFGKAFVHIDKVMISFKQSIFAKEQKIGWEEIRSIEYNLSKFSFIKFDDSIYYFAISKLDDSDLIGLLNIISKLSASKNILFSFPKLNL